MQSMSSLKTALGLLLFTIAFALPAQAGWLYVLSQQNGTANQIYCFKTDDTTGAITPVTGFPVSTGGNGVTGTQNELLVVDKTNNRLYAINKGSNTVSAFNINVGNGALTAMPFSPFTVVTNANTIAVHPSGSPVIIGGNTGTPLSGTYLSDSFVVTATTATRATGSPFSTSGARPFSSGFSRDGNYFYTGGGLSTVWAGFSANNSNGVLATLAGSPISAFTTGVRGYASDSQGRLFTVTAGDGALRVFTTASGVPTAVTGSPFGTSFATFTDGELSPNEQYYVAVDSSTSQLISYAISGSGSSTTVSQASIAPAEGSTTTTFAFNAAGNRIYAINSSSRSISRLTFNQANGALSLLGYQPNNSVGSTGFLTGVAHVEALPPTSASLALGGRVIDGNGFGVKGATVTVIGPEGNILTAVTSPFGYYRFEELPAGQIYLVNASAKGFQFEPRTVALMDEVQNFDLAPLVAERSK